MSHTLTETGKVLTETNFDALCDLLPSKTNWGDTLTPGIVDLTNDAHCGGLVDR